jgi:glyoxylase-like metal-dependent hydrolase (beta-lactamase superfamily II)
VSAPETWEVFAVRYATREDRRRRENFIADPHDGPMPIDFYVWALAGAGRTIVVDTGFGEADAARRARTLLRRPAEGLALLEVDAARVEDVVITHLHYDHAGTLADFPRARFHLQDLEMAYATGRHMAREPLRHAYEVEHVAEMVHHVYAGRVAFHDGDAEIVPGVTVHRIGGHTLGLQCVRVHTGRGWVVLASDASHYYENMERAAPFPIVHDVGAMIEGWDTLRRFADSPRHVVPGHDPLVMTRYPAPRADLAGAVVRLDVTPLP